MKKQILVVALGLYSLLLTSHTASGQPLPNYAIDLSNTNWTYNQLTCELTINTRIFNDGQASSAASRIGFYVLENDAVIRTQDSFIGSVSIGSLAAGSFSDHTFTVRLDQLDGQPPFNKAGDFYAGFKVDDWGMVAELQEMDNEWSTETRITYQPGGEGQIFTRITNDESVQNVRGSVAVSRIDYDDHGDLDLFVSNGEPNDKNDLLRNTGSGSFTRVSSGDIVNDTDKSRSCSWGDYDNDGYFDLFVANNGNNALYRNQGNGTFEKINTGDIVNDGSDSYASTWGDYDNDGFLDLFVANSTGDNLLYHNNGNTAFTKITDTNKFPMVGDGGESVNCSWADYNNDGFLDLFVANRGQDNFLYKNNGNNSFTKLADTSNYPMIGDGGNSHSSSWGDYDNDGNVDLFVANWSNEINFLYHNRGDGTFTKMTDTNEFPMVGDESSSRGSSWGDYNNDGYLDLFVANSATQDNFLYRNKGNGTFEKVTVGDIANDGSRSFGSSWGDFDNDGDLDLFIANFENENNILYSNNGDGTFTKITNGELVTDGGNAEGCTWIDIDNDGDLDLFIANGRESNEVNFLYRNNGNSNSWINIKCIGDISNNSAIGAKVRVKATVNGTSVWQLNEIAGQTGGGFGGHNSLNAEFGLGDASIIDSLKIEWPSGSVQHFVDVSVNQFITISETDGPPAPPQNLNAVAGEQRVSLTWAANDELDFLRYRIYGGTSPNPAAVIDSVNGISNSQITITGLTNDVTHYFRVTAVSQALQESDFSNEVSATPTAAPAPPQNLQATASDQQVMISWDANSEVDLLRYRIYQSTNPSPNTVADSVDGGGVTTKVVTGLQNDTTYFFRITAVDQGLLESDFSNEVSATPGAANTSPVVNSSMPDTTLVLGQNSFARDLDAPPFVFVDDDGDSLTYSTSSSNSAVAVSQVVGSQLTVAAVGVDSADITVQADDGRGGSVSTDFKVLVTRAPDQPPVISLVQAPGQTPADQQVVVEASVQDDRGLEEVLLYYRRGGDVAFNRADMVLLGNVYRVTIPPQAVTLRGIEYLVVAADTSGQTDSSAVFIVRVSTADLESGPLRGGSAQNAYQIISLPIAVDASGPAAVLEDDLGQYDKTSWRLFEMRDSETKVEFEQIANLIAGRGYWLIVNEVRSRFGTGVGLSQPTDSSFNISLHPQWNLVGNPFNFPIPISNLSLSDSQPVELRSFNGDWNNPASNPVTQIIPFEGYAIFNNSNSSTTLLIDPDLSTNGATSSLVKAAPDWSVRILAKCQAARDGDNLLGLHSDADEGADQIDLPEPPVIGEFVSVYFPHPEWRQLAKNYCTDFRPEIGEGQIWEFEVRTNIPDVVNLNFDGLGQVPGELEVWLVEPNLNIVQNLRENQHYAVAASVKHPKRLQILVGPSNFVDERVLALSAIPGTFELSQNFPNPFNPTTTIRFGLPSEQRVTLRIFNILGEEVTTLISDELKSAGFHIAIWDGKNAADQPASSGIYLFQVRYKSTTVTRKMVLVR